MGHFYHRNGDSCHEIMGTSTGRMRPTTIADARKMSLFPSVTTVLDILDKPQLTKWKMDQCSLKARELLLPDTEAAQALRVASDKEYCNTVAKQAMQKVTDAADLGTAIHKAIEQHYRGEEYDLTLRPYVQAVDAKMREEGITFNGHELRLVNEREGYAGTTDAAIRSARGMGILDFKTRKSTPGYPMEAYDGQATQIAAYHVAHYGFLTSIDHAAGANVFISTTEPGRVEVVWHDLTTLMTEWRFFTHLLECYRIRFGHDPRVTA